jgi:hypothetical protein
VEGSGSGSYCTSSVEEETSILLSIKLDACCFGGFFRVAFLFLRLLGVDLALSVVA